MSVRWGFVRSVVASLGCAALLVGCGEAGTGASERPATVYAGSTAQPLTLPSRAAPLSVVADFLRQRGHSADGLRIRREDYRPEAGLLHLRLEQEVDGLRVVGAYAKATLTDDGALVHLIERLAPAGCPVGVPKIDESQALFAAMQHHGYLAFGRPAERLRRGNLTAFVAVAGFYGEPTVERVVHVDERGTLLPGFLVQTWTRAGNLLHHTLVDGSGAVVHAEKRTNTDSYNVYTVDPSRGAQTVVSGPGAGNAQSPAGWLGTGAQTTWNISGNNVKAYLDADANNAADAGGTAVTDGNFVTPSSLTTQPSTASNKNVAVQNLFYLNNVIHDVLYAHGFTEGAGNFQANNFGKGGLGNDPVNAEAQDGSGTDNANMSTPADGQSPRMQMYLWSASLPSEEAVVGGVSYGVRQSAFGPAFTATGITNPLALSATDGCTAYAAGAFTNKIALIARGTCAFTVKVLNAQNAGAKGVLLQNTDAGNYSFSPGGTERKIKIPSAMVGNADGAILRGLAGQNTTLRKKATPPPMIDGDLDSDVVFHEYGHGLTWRMIGGMSGTLAGAIGEGASDTVAFLVNGRPLVGTYAYSNPTGIRRFSYEGYPYTYKDVGNAGYEVHNDGEIYAAAMWKVRANYLAAGLATSDLFRDFIGGMRYTPATPAFEQMRDGMLQATAGDLARQCAIWRGFAATGIGVGASGKISNRGVVTIVESFTLPSTCP